MLTEDENSVSFYICFLAISSIINRMLSYYLLLRSFTQRDLVVSHCNHERKNLKSKI